VRWWLVGPVSVLTLAARSGAGGQPAAVTTAHFALAEAGGEQAEAERALALLERAYALLVGPTSVYGFPEPRDLPRYRGSPRQPVPVLGAPPPPDAPAVSPCPLCPWPPRDAPGAVHLLLHLLQRGYTAFADPWLTEGMAVWMESAAARIPPHGFVDTATPLPDMGAAAAHFWRFLGEWYTRETWSYDTIVGTDVFRRVLSECHAAEGAGPPAGGAHQAQIMEALARAVRSLGETEDATFGDVFARWATLNGKRLGEACAQEGPAPIGRPRVLGGTVRPWGIAYMALGPALEYQDLSVAIEAVAGDPPALPSCQALVVGELGPVRRRYVHAGHLAGALFVVPGDTLVLVVAGRDVEADFTAYVRPLAATPLERPTSPTQ